MSEVQKVNLIDEQKNTEETIQVSTVGSCEFENTELTGLWVDSDTGNLEVYIKDQPQLTIPKSVADELEKYDFELTSKGLMYRNMGGTLVEFSRVTYDEIPQLIVQTIAGNYRIVFAYLNPLTCDLVKVEVTE